MMLEVALKFEKAFARYEEEDDKFVGYFLEKENGKKMIGPPTSNDWECASIFVKFLATFYEVTLKFSGTLQVTSNNFYHEICEIHSQLVELADANDPLLSKMAVSMKKKYDKYWGNADNINPLIFLAVVLDPRYKMKYLRYCFDSVYDSESAARIIVKVEGILQCLFICYADGKEGAHNKDVEGDSPPRVVPGKEIRRRRLLETYMRQQQTDTAENKNDVDKYLSEEPISPMTSSFDILLWWKDNSSRYKTLSLVARDVLVVPCALKVG
ncbi:zinc finger BED domain-containing protein RICESLEEPER 1-like [Apium graveolens]|uniref:zinc finger BED domain-containing protein RICESLEEPER 1-like n=1 Tax=Apium graveolens TaxID=4045 RepID=UPI003D78CD50